MKIKRYATLGVIALLVIAALGAISIKAFAGSSSAPGAQTQPCEPEDEHGAGAQEAADPGDGEEQCSDPEEQEADGREAGDAAAVPAGVTVIPSDLAETIAIAAHPGTVSLVELEEEAGLLIYSVEFEDGAEVELDAVTGKLLGNDPEQD